MEVKTVLPRVNLKWKCNYILQGRSMAQYSAFRFIFPFHVVVGIYLDGKQDHPLGGFLFVLLNVAEINTQL